MQKTWPHIKIGTSSIHVIIPQALQETRLNTLVQIEIFLKCNVYGMQKNKTSSKAFWLEVYSPLRCMENSYLKCKCEDYGCSDGCTVFWSRKNRKFFQNIFHRFTSFFNFYNSCIILAISVQWLIRNLTLTFTLTFTLILILYTETQLRFLTPHQSIHCHIIVARLRLLPRARCNMGNNIAHKNLKCLQKVDTRVENETNNSFIHFFMTSSTFFTFWRLFADSVCIL